MIARLIAWSARNLLLVLFGTGFAAAAGIYALAHLPLDAIPDLSDTQVIVYTEYPGQAPQVIEDQVTYPLTTAMLTVPRSKVVRGFSFFGVSFVYVIFEDGTDIYWARSRVLEFLNGAASRLPAGVSPTMGPDATGVGWVYQYAVMSKELNLSDTRAIQDWNLKFALAKAEGVAEVASVGGFVRQYNVVLDSQRMRDLGITMQKVREAIRASNADVGGRTVELSEFEYVIRGKGYLKSINDLGNIVLKTSNGTPVLLKDVARVELGPDERRGITELNGEGEVAGGIVLQRFGVNALDVIQNVKKRFAEIASSLPKSLKIVAVYDRSNLIHAAIETLKHTLLEESGVVALVCIVFLLHFRSALVAILMLPVGVLMAFGGMKLLGLGSNIMSLGGIAIAIGAMIDAAIVMIENAHKHLERAEPGQPRVEILIEAAAEVGPALFFSLLIITVSFMPIFTLESQEGRLFSPLAFTKTFAMAAAAVLSVTLVPALMVVCVRGKIVPERSNPINRFLIWIYRPVIRAVIRAKALIILIALMILAVTIWPARQLGTEFIASVSVAIILAVLGLTGVPMVIGQYRERGILRRLAATPVRPLTLLLADLMVWTASAIVSVALLIAVARSGFGVPAPHQAGWFVLSVLLGIAALFSLGMLVAAVAPTARSAAGLGWLLFFPNMFLAGVYFPTEEMSPVMRQIGNFTPLGSALHAVRDSWMGLTPRPEYLGIMAAYAVIAGALAARFFRWEQA